MVGPATFCFYLGWRFKSEVLRLQWEQVNLGEGYVRLYPQQSKNRKPRMVFQPQRLLRLLEEQRQRTPDTCPWVFNKNGKPIRKPYKAWKKALLAVGLSNRISHDFRRTNIVHMIRSGIPAKVAQMISGHVDASVFSRYHIIEEADLRKAARTIDQLVEDTFEDTAQKQSNKKPVSH